MRVNNLTGCSVVAYRARKLFSMPVTCSLSSLATLSPILPSLANLFRSWVQLVVI